MPVCGEGILLQSPFPHQDSSGDAGRTSPESRTCNKMAWTRFGTPFFDHNKKLQSARHFADGGYFWCAKTELTAALRSPRHHFSAFTQLARRARQPPERALRVSRIFGSKKAPHNKWAATAPDAMRALAQALPALLVTLTIAEQPSAASLLPASHGNGSAACAALAGTAPRGNASSRTACFLGARRAAAHSFLTSVSGRRRGPRATRRSRPRSGRRP
mmetsp:Transcript_19771/g.58836  ORF Transcript_19771/g.58836 Transcript_19771/m.58836 type:complete len:217 (-) Transcript_19771:33-683(-)